MDKPKNDLVKNNVNEIDADFAVIPFKTFILILLATIAGAFIAILVLPIWMPGMSASLQGDFPKVFWFLSRSSAIVAYALLWLALCFGVLITNKLARLWPGGPVAFDMHQYAVLLGLAFALFHALILMGDRYINLSLPRVLTPFASLDYRPLAVGFGQVAFYLMVVIAASFYLRRRLTVYGWRWIHYLGYGAYLMAVGHGIFSGTDSGAPWARFLYGATGGLLLFLFIYRVLASRFKPQAHPVKQTA